MSWPRSSCLRLCCLHVLLHDACRVTVAHSGKKKKRGCPLLFVSCDYQKNKQKQSPVLASVEPTLASRFSPAPDMCHISFTSFCKIKKETVCLLCIIFFFSFLFYSTAAWQIQHTMYVYQSPYIYRIGWLAGVAVHVFV